MWRNISNNSIFGHTDNGLYRLIQTYCVKRISLGCFLRMKKCSQLENSLSYCVNACNLRRSERAFTWWLWGPSKGKCRLLRWVWISLKYNVPHYRWVLDQKCIGEELLVLLHASNPVLQNCLIHEPCYIKTGQLFLSSLYFSFNCILLTQSLLQKSKTYLSCL